MKKKKLSIIAGVTAICSKVFANSIPMPLYGPPPSQTSVIENFLKVLQTIFAPILFLIGIIIYLKKSKDSKKRKIIMTIIYLLLLVGVYYGVEFWLSCSTMVL